MLISPKHRGSGQRNQMSSAGCPSGQLVKWAIVAFLIGSLESLLEASSHRPEPRKRVHGKTLEGNPLTNSRTGGRCSLCAEPSTWALHSWPAWAQGPVGTEAPCSLAPTAARQGTLPSPPTRAHLPRAGGTWGFTLGC